MLFSWGSFEAQYSVEKLIVRIKYFRHVGAEAVRCQCSAGYTGHSCEIEQTDVLNAGISTPSYFIAPADFVFFRKRKIENRLAKIHPFLGVDDS